MIGYITLGTNKLQEAAEFYDKVLSRAFDATRHMEEKTFIAWGTSDSPGEFCVMKPYNNAPATVGNGTMISLQLKSQKEVDEIYALALELGGACEGKPGYRQIDSFYASYFRDLDGNKICTFHYDPKDKK
jgi:predicted lactoylglutathione lyase